MELHHSEAVIAADYDLSERLGAELLAADCMPEHTVRQEKRGQVRTLRYDWSSRGGEIIVTPRWEVEYL